jgi:glutamine amidotransferase
MITLVNYGLGNVQAFVNIYKRLKVPVTVVDRVEELSGATKIILPGVGAFDWAMSRINESGMRECLDDLVLVKKKPVLGVCVGMQIMAQRSDEGEMEGLGWIDGEVKKIPDADFSKKVRLPHMGWNDVWGKGESYLLKGMDTVPRFYFLHSYFFLPRDPHSVSAVTDYNGKFAAGICSENIFGVQFHPEKSHQSGIQLLKIFAEL